MPTDYSMAVATKNYMARNSLMDWLAFYGKDHGFKQDNELPGYDSRTDFTNFLLGQGNAFEAAVTRHLASPRSLPNP